MVVGTAQSRGDGMLLLSGRAGAEKEECPCSAFLLPLFIQAETQFKGTKPHTSGGAFPLN